MTVDPFASFTPEIGPPSLPESDVSYAVDDTDVGRLLLAVGADGRLLACTYVASDGDEEPWLQRLADAVSPRVLHHRRALDTARRELDAYLSGRADRFSVPVDLVLASAFQRRVLTRLSDQAPYGHTTTYGALAGTVGQPAAARAVGTALGANPLCVFVPCHRVLPAGGGVDSAVGVGGYAGGSAAKEHLLTLEAAHRSSL